MAFFGKRKKKESKDVVDEEFEAHRAPFDTLCGNIEELSKTFRAWINTLSGCGETMMALAQTLEKYYEDTDSTCVSRKFMMTALRVEMASKDFIENTQGIAAEIDSLQVQMSSLKRKVETRDKLLVEYNKALRSLHRGDKLEPWHQEAKVSYKRRNKEVRTALIDFTANRATYIDRQMKVLVTSQIDFFRNSSEGSDILKELLEHTPAQVWLPPKPKKPKDTVEQPESPPHSANGKTTVAITTPPPTATTTDTNAPVDLQAKRSTLRSFGKKSLPPPPKPEPKPQQQQPHQHHPPPRPTSLPTQDHVAPQQVPPRAPLSDGAEVPPSLTTNSPPSIPPESSSTPSASPFSFTSTATTTQKPARKGSRPLSSNGLPQAPAESQQQLAPPLQQATASPAKASASPAKASASPAGQQPPPGQAVHGSFRLRRVTDPKDSPAQPKNNTNNETDRGAKYTTPLSPRGGAGSSARQQKQPTSPRGDDFTATTKAGATWRPWAPPGGNNTDRPGGAASSLLRRLPQPPQKSGEGGGSTTTTPQLTRSPSLPASVQPPSTAQTTQPPRTRAQTQPDNQPPAAAEVLQQLHEIPASPKDQQQQPHQQPQQPYKVASTQPPQQSQGDFHQGRVEFSAPQFPAPAQPSLQQQQQVQQPQPLQQPQHQVQPMQLWHQPMQPQNWQTFAQPVTATTAPPANDQHMQVHMQQLQMQQMQQQQQQMLQLQQQHLIQQQHQQQQLLLQEQQRRLQQQQLLQQQQSQQQGRPISVFDDQPWPSGYTQSFIPSLAPQFEQQQPIVVPPLPPRPTTVPQQQQQLQQGNPFQRTPQPTMFPNPFAHQ